MYPESQIVIDYIYIKIVFILDLISADEEGHRDAAVPERTDADSTGDERGGARH